MLKLHAGVSKKVGLPGFSSASASCTIEAELDSSLLQDREGFQVVVRRAYQSCEKAVNRLPRSASGERLHRWATVRHHSGYRTIHKPVEPAGRTTASAR